MKRNLSALFLCLLMIASSLAGCMGTDDSADDSAVTELENEITMQDEKIAELEAEIATLTTQHQDAIAELASAQSTLQSAQTSLDSAEANATMHQAEISSLEAERNTAQAEISMLYELMSNMSDQSNETFESMALQIAELNQHMSNLSSMLNESYDRHQENSTLVTNYLNQIQSLNQQLIELTIAYEDASWAVGGDRYDIGSVMKSVVDDILEESLGEGIYVALDRPGTIIRVDMSNMQSSEPHSLQNNLPYWEISITIGNDESMIIGNDDLDVEILNWSGLDFNDTNWDRMEYIFNCNGPNGGDSRWVAQCFNFDNSYFRYAEIGEFDGATLRYADFSYSSGTYLRFRNTNMTHAVFANSNYESGWFNNADLTYTDFNNVTFTMFNPPNGYRNDFSNSNLSYSNFNDASLYGLTFANADLTGATFVGTAFVGNNVWSNTICPDGTNSNDNGNTCENNL